MKTIKLLPIFILLFGFSIGQETVSDIDLEKYLNKKVEFCDHVHGTFVSKGKSKVILLNLGAEYPNHRLVVAIFEKNWKSFDYKPAEFLKGKDICVKGKLILYKGKPEIIVNKPDQIIIN